MLNRWIQAREGFFGELRRLALPIIFQNLIAAAVTMADVVMLGRVTQTALSASSLAGQVQFLLNIVYFGLSSALTILASQYWGKKDRMTIGKIFGMGLIISLVFSAGACVCALIAPRTVMRVWTNIPELIDAGARYLRFAAFSYLFAGITQPYHSIMKSCENVLLSSVISTVTLAVNVILNAVLIFGLLGAPAMGIEGAALATTISRGVELCICTVHFTGQKMLPRHPLNIFRIPRLLVADFVRYSMPAFVNDAMWGFAFNMNSIIMGHLGSDIVAANSIVTVARDLISTVGFALAAACSIMLGKEIGEGRAEMARGDASLFMKVTFLTALAQGAVLLVISPFVPHMVRISANAASMLRIMLLVNSVYQIGIMINTLLIASIFRCGGDSRYGMVLDIICMWFIAVPLGLISAFVLKLPPLIVYLFMCTDEFVKMPFALRHYFKGKWIRNLTREF